LDINGRTGAVPFRQRVLTGVKTGTFSGSTVTLMVVTAAHCPAEGVKANMVMPGKDVFMEVGFHVPGTPLLEVKGRTGAIPF
jgi:hypothetical protein